MRGTLAQPDTHTRACTRKRTQDVEDPSDLVVLRLSDAEYTSSFAYYPTTRTVERSNRTYTRCVVLVVVVVVVVVFC